MDQIDKIYICHYTPLIERKEYMLEQCKKYKINDKLIFIKKFDREHILPFYLSLFDTEKVKMCEISLFMKHITAMKKIIKSEQPYGIIMEDDVIFKDNFLDNFNHIMRTVPNDFDVLYVGFFQYMAHFKRRNIRSHPIPIHAESIGSFKNMTNTIVFPWTYNNKGTDFYIISKKCCSMFLEYITFAKKNNITIDKPIDWFMGQLLFQYKANIYWTKNEITLHGSWGDGPDASGEYINAVFKCAMPHHTVAK